MVKVILTLGVLLTSCKTEQTPICLLKPQKVFLAEITPNTIGLHNSAPEIFVFQKKSKIDLSLKPDIIP